MFLKAGYLRFLHQALLVWFWVFSFPWEMLVISGADEINQPTQLSVPLQRPWDQLS